MARNRYDRDDDREYGRNWRGGGRGSEDRYGSERGYGPERGSGPLDRSLGYDDPYGARRGGAADPGRYYGRDDYGRGGYGERADYRQDERRFSNYSGGRGEGRGREYDRDDDSRSWYEGARDYAGGGRSEERGRGASRSHVRCRDIMTRDVTVATRCTRWWRLRETRTSMPSNGFTSRSTDSWRCSITASGAIAARRLLSCSRSSRSS